MAVGTPAVLIPEYKAHYGAVANYVDGGFVHSESTRVLPIENPATGAEIGTVALSTAAEVDAAVQAAQTAFAEWRRTPPQNRIQYLFKLKHAMEARFEDLARVVTQEHGKTLEEARGSVMRAVEHLEVASGMPSLMMGYNLEDGAAPGIDEEMIRQPLGVFGCIAPFNFPTMVPFWFWPYAVATGNTYVIKPTEQAPISQSLIFEILDEVGLPAGVMNMVHGDKEVVDALRLQRGHQAQEARAGAGRGQEPPGGHAGRGAGQGRSELDQLLLRLCRRAVLGGIRPGVRR
jgi:malonate-semialdehyde dehydrogenase (acetylating)/methylmalonate-semialdehyde dehydrogenase